MSSKDVITKQGTAVPVRPGNVKSSKIAKKGHISWKSMGSRAYFVRKMKALTKVGEEYNIMLGKSRLRTNPIPSNMTADQNMTVIDFTDYQSESEFPQAFIGKELGDKIRKKSKIDDLIQQYDKIEIKIPESIITFNPSFLEAFLRKAIEKYGKAGFEQKVFFTSSGNYKIDEDVKRAVDSIVWENAIH